MDSVCLVVWESKINEEIYLFYAAPDTAPPDAAPDASAVSRWLLWKSWEPVLYAADRQSSSHAPCAAETYAGDVWQPPGCVWNVTGEIGDLMRTKLRAEGMRTGALMGWT